jgi:Domain of unknown function DUF11/Secretion system C-terminal sorting domain/CARDB
MLHTTHIYAFRISVFCLFLQCFAVLTHAQNQAGLLTIIGVNGATSAKAGQIVRLDVTVKNTGITPSKPDSVYIGQIVNQPYNSYLEVIAKQVPIVAMNVGETRIFSVDFVIKTPFLVGATNPTITYTFTRSTPFIGIKSNILPPNSAYTTIGYLKGFEYPITPILPKTNIDIQLAAAPNFKIAIKNNGSEIAKNLYIKFPCTSPYACLNLNVSKGNANYLPPIDSRTTPPFRTDRYWYIPDLAIGETAIAEAEIPDGFFEKANSFLTIITASSVEFENTGKQTASLTLNSTKGKADLIITAVKAGTPTPNMGALGKEYLIKPTITIKNIGTEPVNITDNNPIIGYVKVSNNQTDAAYSVLDNFGTSFTLPKQIPVGGSVTVTTADFPVYEQSCNQKLYINTQIYTGRITELKYDNNALLGTPFTCPLTTPTPSTNAVIGTMTAEPATSKQWGYNKITLNIENTTDVAIPNALVSFNFPPADIAIATDADKKPVATIGTVLSFGPWDIGTLPARSKHTLVFYVFVRTSDKPIEITTTFHNKLTSAYYTVVGAAVTLQPAGIVQPPTPPTSIGNVTLTMTADPTTYAQWGYNKITITVENKTGADIPQANVSLGASSYEDVVFATEASKKGVVSIGTATQYIWTLGSFPANAKHTWTFYTFAKTSGKPLTIYSYFHKVLNQAGYDATITVVLQPKGTTPPPTPSGTKPDLSIENFKLISPINIPQGQLGYFTFDLKNTGAPVFGDYTLGVYIYPPREPNKAILVGAIPTGNTPIGTITNVKGDFTTIIDDKIASGNYILSIKIDDKNIVNESNEANNEVLSNIFISPRLVSDLQVTVTTTPAQYKQYSNQTLQITVKNNGIQTTNGIKVSFEYLLSALPYVNNEVSTGVYNQITKIWEIGAMNGNQAATLKLVLFPLVKDQDLPVTATLIPNDSNPTNNIATVTLKPILITPRSPKDIVPTQAMPIVIHSLFPNPTENDVFFQIESLDEREIIFEIRDSFGKMIQRKATKMTGGENQVLLHIDNLPQGLYFVTPITSNSQLLPLKLMKL